MNTGNIEEYTERPIYLHALNCELHSAIGKGVDHERLLHSVRIFSVLSCQRMFCNVSQIHEVFHAHPLYLAELTELAKIDRVIAHSDYGSFDEFRESRLEKFAHSQAKHPAFFVGPSAELVQLPHSTMGKDVSTTGHIEAQLKGWIESGESSLHTTLSQVDKKNLRHCEDWLERTLRLREKKALTFDVFEHSAESAIAKSDEGAIRRALTEAYIDSYIGAFDPRCLWGYYGISHFERFRLLTGLNVGFGQTILKLSGVDEYLSERPEWGQHERLLGEESQAMSYLRQEYAELALVFDERSDLDGPWHQRKSVVTSNLQKIRHLELLSPRKEGRSFQDRLNYAGEAIKRTRISIEVPSSVNGSYGVIVPKSASGNEPREVDALVDERRSVSFTDGKKEKPNVVNHSVLVLIVGLALALITYLLLPLSPISSEMSLSLRFVYSVLSGLIASCFAYWFHPDFYYRRMAFFGLGLATVGGLSYDIKVFGLEWLGESRFELGSLPSNLLIVVGMLFTGFCMGLDYLQRKDALQ